MNSFASLIRFGCGRRSTDSGRGVAQVSFSREVVRRVPHFDFPPTSHVASGSSLVLHWAIFFFREAEASWQCLPRRHHPRSCLSPFLYCQARHPFMDFVLGQNFGLVVFFYSVLLPELLLTFDFVEIAFFSQCAPLSLFSCDSRDLNPPHCFDK